MECNAGIDTQCFKLDLMHSFVTSMAPSVFVILMCKFTLTAQSIFDMFNQFETSMYVHGIGNVGTIVLLKS